MSLEMRSAGLACRRSISTLPAEIDVNNADQVSGALLQALDEHPAVLVADMTATAFCAVAGIHALTRACHQAGGTELRVAARARIVRRVLELTRLNELAGIYPSLEAALAEPPAAGDASSSPPGSNDGRGSRTARPADLSNFRLAGAAVHFRWVYQLTAVPAVPGGSWREDAALASATTPVSARGRMPDGGIATNAVAAEFYGRGR